MKKLRSIVLFSVALVVAGLALVSCGDDDNNEQVKEPSVAEQYAGVYSAIDNVNVNGSADADYNAKTENAVRYTVTANADGTINLAVPAESYKGLFAVGDISLGEYTISNIAWDASKNAFCRKYGKDGVTCHFTSSTMHIDKDYQLTADECEVVVTKDADSAGKLHVKNVFKMGKMPVTIYVSFDGSKIAK